MARFVVLVIDSFGVGAMKDVTLVRPQDAGANTCGHILSQLPHLQDFVLKYPVFPSVRWRRSEIP